MKKMKFKKKKKTSRQIHRLIQSPLDRKTGALHSSTHLPFTPPDILPSMRDGDTRLGLYQMQNFEIQEPE